MYEWSQNTWHRRAWSMLREGRRLRQSIAETLDEADLGHRREARKGVPPTRSFPEIVPAAVSEPDAFAGQEERLGRASHSTQA